MLSFAASCWGQSDSVCFSIEEARHIARRQAELAAFVESLQNEINTTRALADAKGAQLGTCTEQRRNDAQAILLLREAVAAEARRGNRRALKLGGAGIVFGVLLGLVAR